MIAAVAAVSMVVAGGIALTPSASGAPGVEAAKKLTPRAGYYQYGNWERVGSGFNSDQVYTILKDDTGTLFAAGTFRASNLNTVNRVAKFTGTAWSDLGTDDSGVDPTLPTVPAGNAQPYPPAYPGVYGAALSPSGALYIGGQFTKVDDTQVNNVARWTGTSWQKMGMGLYNALGNLTSNANQVEFMVAAADDTNYADDTIYALGEYGGICGDATCTAGGRSFVNTASVMIAQWRDDTWYPLPTSLGSVTDDTKLYTGAYLDDSAALEGDDTLYVGGVFAENGGNNLNNVAAWRPADNSWSSLGLGLNGPVNQMVVHPVTKDLYVVGYFTREDGGRTGLVSVAKWDYLDDTWYPVGNFDGVADVATISISPNGEHLYIGGRFSYPVSAGGQSQRTFDRIAVLSGGDLSAGGTSVGGQWLPLLSAGAYGVSASVRSLIANNDGSVYVAGDFTTAGPLTSTNRVALFTPGPEPDPNVPATPPGPPLNVVAKGGWQTVTVSWDPPIEQGTYPITNYLAQATAVGAAPAGNVCITRLTDAKLTECTFTSLKPGVQYTFKVQGLNGGGWGARSEPSNIATPYELKVTGYGRKKLSFLKIPLGSEVSAKGTSLGYPAGTRITVFIKEGDSGQWVEQKNSGLTTNAAGTFSWQRKFSRGKDGTPISVQFGIGPDRSNAVRIPPVK
jgi:hypothetical protein